MLAIFVSFDVSQADRGCCGVLWFGLMGWISISAGGNHVG